MQVNPICRLLFRGCLAVLFVVSEVRARQPLLPLRLFRSVTLSAGVVLVVLMMFAMYGALFFMTFYLQNVHGLVAIAAGVHLLPLTAMLMVGAPLSSIAMARIGPRVPMAVGLLLAAAAFCGLSRLTVGSSANSTIIWFVMLGAGLAPVIVARAASSLAARPWNSPGWPADFRARHTGWALASARPSSARFSHPGSAASCLPRGRRPIYPRSARSSWPL